MLFEHTNEGSWKDIDDCPNAEKVNEFKTRNEALISGDNTALNGVELKCTGGTSVTSHTGSWGSFSDTFKICDDGLFTGAKVAVCVPSIW